MIPGKLKSAGRFSAAFAQAALLAVIALVIGAHAASARPLDEVVASKILRIVVYKDNQPFSWVEGDVVKGIDVDLGRAIAKKLGVEAEFIARMTGEKVDDDLRFNIWKGPVAEGGVGDVMLHVPVDRELMARNNMAVISNPYFQERVALAIDPARTGPSPDFSVFKKEKVGVLYATVSDYFLMRYEDGALMNNIVHHTKVEDGVRQFANKETSAMLGVQSELEGVFAAKGLKAVFANPPMTGIVRTNWYVGTAVKDNSRDLGYAIGTALEELRTSGDIEKIFAQHAVTYIAPVAP